MCCFSLSPTKSPVDPGNTVRRRTWPGPKTSCMDGYQEKVAKVSHVSVASDFLQNRISPGSDFLHGVVSLPASFSASSWNNVTGAWFSPEC